MLVPADREHPCWVMMGRHCRKSHTQHFNAVLQEAAVKREKRLAKLNGGGQDAFDITSWGDSFKKNKITDPTVRGCIVSVKSRDSRVTRFQLRRRP